MQSETEARLLVEDTEKSLELKKLALEIADLERPWWKRPAYVLAFLPTMLAFGTLLVGAFTGYFQAEYTKLENQRHDLEVQRGQLQQQVQGLEEQRDTLMDAAKKYAAESSVPKASPTVSRPTPTPFAK